MNKIINKEVVHEIAKIKLHISGDDDDAELICSFQAIFTYMY